MGRDALATGIRVNRPLPLSLRQGFVPKAKITSAFSKYCFPWIPAQSRSMPFGMGPLHGKLVTHRPTGRIGIARTRTVADGFEYSLLLANGERTEFLPGNDLKRPKRAQREEFVNAKRASDLLRRSNEGTQSQNDDAGERPCSMNIDPA